MQIQVHSTADVFSNLRGDWNALLKQSPSDSIFLTREFQQTWWTHLGSGELRVLTAHDDGHLRGIAPLYLDGEPERRVLRLVGGLEVADYLDIICEGPQVALVLEALLGALARQDDWQQMDLRNVPERSPTRVALPLLAAQQGWTLHEQVEEVCPLVALPATFEDYLNSLEKKQRHEIRRKLRKAYAEAEIHCYSVDAQQDIGEAAAAFIALHQRSQLDKTHFMTRPMIDFFTALARVMHDAGWVELAFVEVNGQRAATYFDFVYNNQTLCYNSGYDPQAYAQLSPGIVLLAYLIERAITQGRTTFDFLQGNETYKYRMGAADTRVYQLTLSRP